MFAQRLQTIAWWSITFILLSCQENSALREPNAHRYESAEFAATVCASGERIRGIDVSKWQGTIDWDAVAQTDTRFVFIRASDGTNYLDEQFYRNWSEAERVGLLRGVYQYFRPDQDVASQAQILLERMGPMGPGVLPPVIDVEEPDAASPAEWRRTVGEWIDIVEGALGVRPIIYTGGYFWDGSVDSSAWADYPLWVPHWGTDCPNLPTAWSDWVFHQDSDSGRVSGISGNVDTNWFNGSYQDLLNLSQGIDACAAMPAAGGTIDNGTDCFSLRGPLQYWRTEPGGFGSDYRWTNATDNDSAVNAAVWRMRFERDGQYEIEMYVGAGTAASVQAPYAIEHRDGTTQVSVDQSLSDGWHSIGTYFFEAGPNYTVTLSDNSGEPNNAQIRMVADGLRVISAEETIIEPDASTEPDGDTGQDAGVASDMGDANDGVQPENQDMTREPDDVDMRGTVDSDASVMPVDLNEGLETNANHVVALRYNGVAGCQLDLNASGRTWVFFVVFLAIGLGQRRFPLSALPKKF